MSQCYCPYKGQAQPVSGVFPSLPPAAEGRKDSVFQIFVQSRAGVADAKLYSAISYTNANFYLIPNFGVFDAIFDQVG